MKKLICVLFALFVLLAAGCSAAAPKAPKDNSSSAASKLEYYESAAADMEAPMDAPAEFAPEPAAAESGSSLGGLEEAKYVKNDRKLIYTSEYTIETKSFEADYNAVIAAAENAGGFVSSEETHGTKPEVYGDSGRTSSLTLRIPVDKYSDFLSGLEGVGSIVSRIRSSEDVTTEYYDNEARIELYEKHYEKLMAHLEKAEKMEDIIAIESEMTNVLYTIDQLKGNKRYMDDLVEYCTVNVLLREVVEYSEVSISNDTFGSRVSGAFNSVLKWLGRFFEGFAIVFIAALPVLAIIAVIFLAIFLPLRAARRKKLRAGGQIPEKKRGKKNGAGEPYNQNKFE